MLVIRDEQMQILNDHMLAGFEKRLLGYLTGRFPDVCPPENEESVRESIQKGIDRARSYGITTEYDIARYIELMYVLSEDFDTSPGTPWATAILEDPNLGGHVKMDRLWESAAQESSK